MKRRRHVGAMAELVAGYVRTQPRPAARLLQSRLRCAVEEREQRVAHELGVAELVEQARDEHLASLGADDGLVALCVDWAEVAEEAVRLLDAAPSRCERCGARLPRRGRVCGRCRRPVPGRA